MRTSAELDPLPTTPTTSELAKRFEGVAIPVQIKLDYESYELLLTEKLASRATFGAIVGQALKLRYRDLPDSRGHTLTTNR
jgi:hypothetical protein